MITNDLLRKKVLYYFFENVLKKYETKLEKTKDNFDIQTGKKDANFGDSSGEYPFYTCALVPIKSKTYSYDGEYLILPGNGANVGSTIYFKGKFEAYQRTYLISSKNDKIDLKYAYYYYLAYWQQYNQNKMYGSAIPYIRLGNLENFEILYPVDIMIQKNIVSQLDSIFEMLDRKNNNDQQKSNLKNILKNKILDSAMHGNLVERNCQLSAKDFVKKLEIAKEEYILKNKLSKSKESKTKNDLFDIPDTWCWTTLGDICFVTKLAGFEYTKDVAPNLSKKGDVPVVRAQNIKPNCFIDECSEYITMDLSKKLYRCALDSKCILMTFIGAGIGEVCIFDKEERYHLAPNVAKIVPGIDINKYIMYYLMSTDGKRYIFDYKKSTAQASLSMETIRNVSIPIPPLEELNRIVEKIESLFELIEQL